MLTYPRRTCLAVHSSVLLSLALGVGLVVHGPMPMQAASGDSATLELKPGDHICFIGNGLPDRMQHDGWLETLLQTRFPKHQLVFRNLGFMGDELTLRMRSADFGSPDQHLTYSKADVVFAFFGYNESFAGPDGLNKFKGDLEEFIKHTLGQKYNGKSAPRLVLVSPIAHENLHDRNLPDGKENNQRLELYTAAMRQVALAHHIPFVDLFKPAQELYQKATKPLTVNGIHLNSEGNRLIAEVIDRQLFGGNLGSGDKEKLRQAVLDKNFYWFERYRTVDGYNVYGGRADLRFVDGQSNRDVMEREMDVLAVMAANRDKRIWAVAQGDDLKVDDNNTPPFIPVKTNKPGNGPNGTHIFLDGDQAISKMTLGKGLKINLFASEKEFPELAKPVQMAWDAKGRLWVAVWPTYPHWRPKEEMNDKILILEDTDGDGKADKVTVFADHLHCPTGFAFYNGGVLVAQAPYLVYLKDTDGDDRADVRINLLGTLDSADTHHTSNSFVVDPGGAVYFQEGTFHRSQVETPYGPPERLADAGVFRYEPRTHKFEIYVSYAFANPHGHVFDRWGQDFVTDGTGAVNYYGTAFSGKVNYPLKHPGMKAFFPQRTRPCPGTEILSSRHFPPEFQGDYLVANVIGFQGILRYKIHDEGSAVTGEETEPIVYSSDPNFRPSAIEMGPDGAIYFLDWQNPIIGHMQHNLRDPSRDRTHGRIYRVTYEGRPLLTPVKISGEPIDKLLDLLKEPEDRVRARARLELGSRESGEVVAGIKKWIGTLDRNDPEHEHHLLEALWVHQGHNVVNVELLHRLLTSSDFRARAAATRVLCYWRDRVPHSLDLLRTLAADPHPRVRLQAVRAASFYTVPEAVEVAIISAQFPSDYYLNYTRAETMRTLEPYYMKAVAVAGKVPATTEAGVRFFLKNMSLEDLLKLERDRAVDVELLSRKGVREEIRRQAVTGLAKLDHKSEAHELVELLRSHDKSESDADESVLFDLVHLLTSQDHRALAAVRPELEKMATQSRQAVTRQLGFVVLVAADGNVDRVWELGTRSVAGLRDLLTAMPSIADPGLRANLYPRVEPLLDGLPKSLALSGRKASSSYGRFVRIELPGPRRTLTLAEVEVYSDGRNIAPQGHATQKNTSNGGEASRAIDGNKGGHWSSGGQTHTEENTANPWWELDLGAEYPIESIVVYNRTDAQLGRRLQGFTLKVLDSARHDIFAKERIPAPAPRFSVELSGGGLEGTVRRLAMTALASVRGQEEPTFKRLARFVREGVDRPAAIEALQRIPPAFWPKDEARPLLDSLVAYIRGVPVRERTTPAVLDALQLGYGLAALLPSPDGKQIRHELGELGVRVIRLGTVPEQMLFDKDRMVVQAGKPVEIIFENYDLMPHNFVVTQPGALEEVGILAEASATQPGALERHYVPASNKILHASRLLQPRQTQKLSFTAPLQPGVYPYVCTYPGHWRRMYGALYVLADLDDYSADPEGYLVKHPLPAQDDLLKSNRPRKEWKFADLDSVVEHLDHGRSFANGKQMFQVANCVACHRLNAVGTEIGPDLSKLDPKLKPAEILRDVLEPSFKINEKYYTYILETKSGKLITGLILEESPTVVKVVENPLVKSQAIVLKPADIVSREKSPTSIMPKGLLDKLTREEILDLMAYIIARGNPRSPLFEGQHEHGHVH